MDANSLLSLLVQKKAIPLTKVEEFKKESVASGKPIEDLLIEKKIVDSEDLVKYKAEVLRLPYQSLLDLAINDKILHVLPLEVSENYKIVCFAKEENKISVGIVDPNNFKAIEAVDFLAKKEGLVVSYFLISKASFDHAFKQSKSFDKELTTAFGDKLVREKELSISKSDSNLEEVTKSAPVAKMVSVIIRHAVEGRASDIHIEPLFKESRVRYRIDGILHTSLILPASVHAAVVARIKVMANLKLDETRIPQDGRIRLVVNDKEVDLRVSVLPLYDYEKVVIRILDVSRGVPTLEDLGFSGIQLEVIKKNIKYTEGLFLVTGPTGSGKSTTIMSVLTLLNREGINISTLEDPVEYFIKGVNQSQVKPEIGYTFANGLRSLLRQDPNVIMVGEVRDLETAELVIHSSLTGHFVLSTLHTNSAFGAIARLLDMKVEPFLLGSTLHTLVAQRLCRSICAHCRTEIVLPAEVVQEIIAEAAGIPQDYLLALVSNYHSDRPVFYKGKGCSRCGNTGYVGRVAITEVIDVNDKVKALIVDKGQHTTMEDIRSTQTFIAMKQDGIIKVLQGLTTYEEVLRVTRS